MSVILWAEMVAVSAVRARKRRIGCNAPMMDSARQRDRVRRGSVRLRELKRDGVRGLTRVKGFS